MAPVGAAVTLTLACGFVPLMLILTALLLAVGCRVDVMDGFDALDVSGHGAERFETPNHNLAHVLTGAFPALARLPQGVTEAPKHVVSTIAPINRPLATKLEMHWERSGTDLEHRLDVAGAIPPILGDGLLLHTGQHVKRCRQ